LSIDFLVDDDWNGPLGIDLRGRQFDRVRIGVFEVGTEIDGTDG
jgi:hypothetical protein